jgi:hypothetical protein
MVTPKPPRTAYFHMVYEKGKVLPVQVVEALRVARG